MASEGADGHLRQPYGAEAGILRLGEYKCAGLVPVPAHALELTVHPERAGFEVYVRPLEAERLALPEPGDEAQNVEGFVAVALRGLEERPSLLLFEFSLTSSRLAFPEALS